MRKKFIFSFFPRGSRPPRDWGAGLIFGLFLPEKLTNL